MLRKLQIAMEGNACARKRSFNGQWDGHGALLVCIMKKATDAS